MMSESMKVVVAGFFDECIVVRPEPDSDQTFGVAVGTPFTIYPGHEPRYTEAEWREKAAPQDARTSLPPEVLEELEALRDEARRLEGADGERRGGAQVPALQDGDRLEACPTNGGDGGEGE